MQIITYYYFRVILADRWFAKQAPPTSWPVRHHGVVLAARPDTHLCIHEYPHIEHG